MMEGDGRRRMDKKEWRCGIIKAFGCLNSAGRVMRALENGTYRHRDKFGVLRKQRVAAPLRRWPVHHALAPTKREDLL